MDKEKGQLLQLWSICKRKVCSRKEVISMFGSDMHSDKKAQLELIFVPFEYTTSL
jgi:hypothetical protein